MKIREAIETVDRLLPNQYETPDKVRWLSELDGIVYRDIICTHEHEKEPEPFTGYGEDVALETELLIPWPYDEIYRWYLGDEDLRRQRGDDEVCKRGGEIQQLLSGVFQRLQPGVHAEAVRDTLQALRR